MPRHGSMAGLGTQLAALLQPYTPKRRLTLLRSLWDSVVQWQVAADATTRARARRLSDEQMLAWSRTIWEADDRWWRAQALVQIGEYPTDAEMLAWSAEQPTCYAALESRRRCSSRPRLARRSLAG